MALDLREGFAVTAASDPAPDRGVDELAIFTIWPVQLKFSIAADFVAAQVANDVLVLALSSGRILRVDLNRPEDIDGTWRRTRRPPVPRWRRGVFGDGSGWC